MPIIFFIIKYYPPRPAEKNFSSLYLFTDITIKKNTKSKFPLWLLIFRLILCFLIILFFSDPYLTKGSDKKSNFKNYTIISDNNWSISNNWQYYKSIIKEIVLEAESNNKEVHFYLSTLSEKLTPTIFNTYNEAIDFINNNPPSPIQTSRKNINEILKKNNFFKSSKTFFIFSNFDSATEESQKETLNIIKENNPSIEIINPVKKITFFEKVVINHESFELKVSRKGIYTDNSFSIQAIGKNKRILFEKKFYFEDASNEYKVLESLPAATINQIFKIKILDENHAGAYFYLDDFKKRVSVGIFSENNSALEKPLLSSTYYLKKSLGKSHSISVASIKKLLDNQKSIIFLPSYSKLIKSDHRKLEEWVKAGGVLVRFSDKSLVSKRSLYFDQKLYYQSVRNIAKDFSLNAKLNINAFKDNTILSNLEIPLDLQFKKQLIIDSFESDVTTLASLEDQSPLITMKNIGSGKVILFHVTSNNEWSNLPLSSLFSDIISRLLLIPKFKVNSNNQEMTMKQKINSFGELIDPLKNYSFVNQSKSSINYPSIQVPVGIYENENLSIALNLAGNLNTESFYGEVNENILIKNSYEKSVFKLKNLILITLFIMFLIDMIINLMLKKNFLFKKAFKKSSIIALFLLFFIVTFNINNLQANENYNKIFLAYVKTEDALLNQIAFKGLESLRKYLIERTSVNPKGVKEVDILRDKIFYFPLLYWQVVEEIPDFNEEIINKINNYLVSGGIIIFDLVNLSNTSISLEESRLNELKVLFSELGVNNLKQIDSNHTLVKSYYLLDTFPGRFDRKVLLIDTDNLDNKDGVSSVIVGLNHWVGAWAKDKNNYPLYQAVPGGERQREISFRFGINLIMYALTGNYKSDQIHNKSILQRLQKK